MLTNALEFLVNICFGMISWVLVIRLLLVFGRISYLHAIVKAIDQITRPVIVPLRRIIPNAGRIESASVVVLFILQIFYVAVASLFGIGLPSAVSLIAFALKATVGLMLSGLFYAVLAQAIVSWIQPRGPAMEILTDITDPLMQPVRRVIPPLGDFDISAIPVLIGLQFFIVLLH